MPTPLGTDTVSSISRRVILPTITDVAYNGNALFYRLNKANKKQISGGRWVEAGFIASKWANGGWYDGFDELDVSPNDTVINGAWEMKHAYVPISVAGTTLNECNTPEAVINLLELQGKQARMKMADILGDAVHGSAVSNAKKVDGLTDIVDNGSVATSYAGLVRASNTFLNAQYDSSTATLTLASLNSMVSSCSFGGHSPTLILSRKEQYNRAWTLLVANQRFNAPLQAADQVLANAGFTNILFNNIPWVLDEKVIDGPNTSNSAILFLNEDYLDLYIENQGDFAMSDFEKPINQNALVSKLYWDGNLVCLRPQAQGIMTNVSA